MNQPITLGAGSRVRHPAFGDGVIVKLYKAAYDVTFMTYGLKTVGRDYRDWEIIEALEAEEVASFNEAEQALIRILRTYNGIDETTKLGDRWIDGTLILQPGEAGLATKEMPIEDFFHKIVMVRDRLRVMEQRINASNLSDEEKVNLQQYITRIYGSLTSFNVLFKYKEDHFKGTGNG
ncbi:hypothetical protein QWY85_16085 [Neolewinella lacunae]|uniref:Uncharacterized protein n=1 Tax=Neolewinella lacunae TaxID=1517758 RepID=A0A923T7G6_9BACT|nr:hypothetical protein [Neolewinella lacunae]MBC6993536.1 hypothetical protein [Neolewinella lacunae]MDN3636188.1 hypothetical protein [Neolewinella lacunae]